MSSVLSNREDTTAHSRDYEKSHKILQITCPLFMQSLTGSFLTKVVRKMSLLTLYATYKIPRLLRTYF